MHAFLLCAGFGTRMRPLTTDTPKSLVEVAGRPLLDYLLNELTAGSALTDIHVAVNHRNAPIFRQWAAAHRADLAAAGIELHLHNDGVESPDDQLGSVGDLKFLLDEVGASPDGALVSGGDSLYRFPLAPILNAYEGTTNDVLALHEPDPARRAHSSVLRLDGATVTEVLDDPTGASSPCICPSWLLLSAEGLRAVPAYLNDGGPPDTLGGFLDRLARTHSVRAHRLPRTANLRLHCNTPDDLKRARRLLRNEPRHVLGPDTVRASLADHAS
ncbi:nucleotidyltransferase family protein [Salinibacter altiplanensis]|uniref:nucleotidyltransferase family protein n=1 Tax=Salinibacter altiplanensis TaxID=1803181 RepID=UPI000C9F43CA|nr:sugar phosphate nucleotidyltransferase [Salinibacter altiplanensis]